MLRLQSRRLLCSPCVLAPEVVLRCWGAPPFVGLPCWSFQQLQARMLKDLVSCVALFGGFTTSNRLTRSLAAVGMIEGWKNEMMQMVQSFPFPYRK